MPDVASLSFNIDSSQARQAIAALEALKATSVQVVQTQQQFTTANTNAAAAYGQQRDQIDRLAQSTKAYDGTLSGLITRLNSLREAMNQSQQSFSAYQVMITQAQGLATTIGASVDALDRYVQKSRELRISQNDLATGLSNITAALKNQTDQGHQARLAIEQLGVSLNGIGANRPEEVVQRIADRLRNFAPTQGTLQASQNIFGAGFGANDLLNLQSQPYLGYRQREANQIQRDLQAQIDQINTANQRRDTATQRDIDERRDLASRYSQSNTLAGRLGLDFITQLRNTSSQTGAQELAELRRISQLPEDQRRGYTGIGAQIGDEFRTGYLGQSWRQLTSGSYSAQQAEIRSRQQQDIQTQGYFPALLNRFGRDLQSLPFVNAYTPQTTDPRGITPFESLQQRRDAADRLAGFGDTSYQRIVQLDEQRRQFGADDVRQTYQRAFGGQEGQRRYTNQLAALQQQTLYAKTPEQEIIDQTARQQQIAALPFEQRAQAQNLQERTRQITGVYGGALSLPQQRAIEGGFRSGVDIQLQQSSENTQRQIDFQKQLSEEVTKGKDAAENYIRAWSAYTEVLRAGATPEQATAQALEQINAAMQARITMGRQVTQQLREENEQRQQQISVAQRNANADPISRRVQELQLGITQNIQQQIAAGQLPNPAGGQYRDPATGQLRTVAAPAEAQAVIDERRRALEQQLAGEGVQGAQGTRQGVQDQARDQQAILDIMREQGVTLDRATRIYETHKSFNEAIAKAAADRSGEAAKEVIEQEKITQEFQRQADITKQVLGNLEAAKNAAQEAQGNQILQGLPPAVQEVMRRLLPLLNQNLQTGGGLSVDQALPLIRQFETGGGTDPAGANVKNYRFDQTHTASGRYQITDTTWREMAPKVGVNLSQYPTAISAPDDVQQTVATRLYQERGFAPWQTNTRLMNAVGGGGGALGGAQLTPEQIAGVQRQATELAAGRPFSFAGLGLPPQLEQSLEEAARQTQQAARSGQQLQVTNQGTALQARIDQLRRQATLTPGEAARVPVLDPTLQPGIREQAAGQQTREVIERQTSQATQQQLAANQALEDERRKLDALSGPLQGYGQRLREVNAQLQAEAEHRANPSIDTEIRKRQLLAEATMKQQEALAEQNKALQDQNELAANLNAAGPFAGPSQLRHVTTETRIQQFQRDNPDLAATPQGQEHVNSLRAQDAIADQTERMNELREATHSAYGAIEQAFTAIAVRGEKGKDVLKSLGQSMEEIFLRTAVFKPFERAMDSLLGSIFGGGDSGGGTAANGAGGQGSGQGGGQTAANDNNRGSGIVDNVVGMLGFGGSTTGHSSGLPIDSGSNAMRVVVVGGGGGGGLGSLLDGKGGGSNDSGGGGMGLLGRVGSWIGKQFSGDSTKDNAVDTAVARANGQAPSLQGSGGGLFDNFFSGIGKLFGGGSGSGGGGAGSGSGGGDGGGLFGSIGKLFNNFPGGLVDAVGGQGFYQGGGLIGSLFGGSSGGGLADLSGGAMTTGIYAKGGVFPGAALANYANQVVNKPTMFRFASGASFGLMGEAGPEAIMPLTRGTDGRLGVANHGGGGHTINFNISTPDADSFRRSQPQIQSRASAAMSRNVTRNTTR